MSERTIPRIHFNALRLRFLVGGLVGMCVLVGLVKSLLRVCFGVVL